MVEARWGHKRGDDDGCFASALASVRRWGGVIEHPAWTRAWPTFGILSPPQSDGWIVADDLGGWTCHVEQRRFGHAARKATWLYVIGVDVDDLPNLWGRPSPDGPTALVSWCQNRTPPPARVGRMHKQQPRSEGDTRPRLSKRAASATPPAFRDELLAIARSARPPVSCLPGQPVTD